MFTFLEIAKNVPKIFAQRDGYENFIVMCSVSVFRNPKNGTVGLRSEPDLFSIYSHTRGRSFVRNKVAKQ